MKTEIAAEKSRSFVLSQMGYDRTPEAKGGPAYGPAITLSQQTGAGAHEIAQVLAEILDQPKPGQGSRWRILDRQLVETVLEEHRLPKRLARHMPEDRRTYIQDVVDELFGLRPPSWVLVPQVIETIEHLIAVGHVIVVGRGANVITSEMAGIFHVRLVASLPRRIERVQAIESLTYQQAVERVEQEDRGSQRYVKAHFHARVDDELLYHLVINTDRVPYPEAARLIVDGAQRCFERSRRENNPGHA